MARGCLKPTCNAMGSSTLSPPRKRGRLGDRPAGAKQEVRGTDETATLPFPMVEEEDAGPRPHTPFYSALALAAWPEQYQTHVQRVVF